MDRDGLGNGGTRPGLSLAVDIWGIDGGLAMELNILTDLRWICLFDTSPCPTPLPLLNGVKLLPTTFRALWVTCSSLNSCFVGLG